MTDSTYEAEKYEAMARAFRKLWLAYKAAGFTDEQATRFIEAQIRAASGNS